MINRIFPVIQILICSVVYADSHITIREAVISQSPPGVDVNAVYLTIENRLDVPVTLDSISSPMFSRIAIHESITHNGVSSMVHHTSVLIPPLDSFEMLPGGFHLMLYNEAKSLKLYDRVPLIFEFSDGTVLDIEIEVRDISAARVTPDNQNNNTPKKQMSYQNFLPQHFLSGMMYHLTRITISPLKNSMIKAFINHFDVDMTIAEQPDPEQYPTFNAFFTRALKQGHRPIDLSPGVIISPVDGNVSQYGHITAGKILQAKNRRYSVNELLGGNEDAAINFYDGSFITLYLSPRDYHRIHMPADGKLSSMTYIPGRLFSVNKRSTGEIENLFAVNERVVNLFDTDYGTMALVMVGAIFVGSMETVWAGEITPPGERQLTTVHYKEKDIHLAKGDEVGRFNMGSTVILLFEKDRMTFNPDITVDAKVVMGRGIATLNN